MPVSDPQLEANKDLARRFVEAFDARDLAAVDDLLADDFVWHVADTSDEETEYRPFQSQLLKRTGTMLPPLRQNREETLAYFANMMSGDVDEDHRFRLRLTNVVAEGDQVVFEALSDMASPINDRRYRNVYSIHLRVRDGKITLYKEYQDTLHIFDTFVAE